MTLHIHLCNVFISLAWIPTSRISESKGKKKKKNVWCLGFPGGYDGKESACSSGDSSSIPRSGRSPGEGRGNPLQYFWLENPMDRGAWQATVHGVSKRWTWPSDFTLVLVIYIINESFRNLILTGISHRKYPFPCTATPVLVCIANDFSELWILSVFWGVTCYRNMLLT